MSKRDRPSGKVDTGKGTRIKKIKKVFNKNKGNNGSGTMNTYQIHFGSSKNKVDHSFDTFYFEPESIYESKAGQLFLAGNVKNDLKIDRSFIPTLAENIREDFYSSRAKHGRTAFRQMLKGANQFLQKIVEKGSVEWLSDFNFGILNILEDVSRKDAPTKYILHFTKVGSLKIILLRDGEVIDLGEKIKEEGIDPYPIKVFHHIASGKIQQDDRILILNQELYESLLQNGGLKSIASISFLSEKKISRVFAPLKQNLHGFCLLIDFAVTDSAGRMKLFFKEKKEYPVIKKIEAVIARIGLSRIPIRPPDFSRILRPFKGFALKYPLPSFVSKNLVWILFLFGLLLVGRFITQKQGVQNQNMQNFEIELAREKVEANEYEPEIFFEWKDEEFPPQRLVISGNDVLCFASSENQVFRIAPDGSSSVFKTDFHLKEAVSLESRAIVFLTEERELVLMEQGQLGTPFSLEKLGNEFQLSHMSSFASSVYFWDQLSMQVVRYSKDEDSSIWFAPHNWLKEPNILGEIKPFSMAIDESIWFLSIDAIVQYYKGEFVKEFSIDISPKISSLAKIFTSKASPYLYIMDPVEGRIILVDKENAEIREELQSDKFKNLKHLVLTEQGVVYLLGEAKIYRVLF